MDIRMYKVSINDAHEMNIVADKVVDAMTYMIDKLDADGVVIPQTTTKYKKGDITDIIISRDFAAGVSDAVIADYIANNP